MIERVWEEHPDQRPGYLGFDDACSLFKHIVTSHPNSRWLNTTRFIVDAWHYIGHQSLDVFCRMWCNPAPKNGSQPDLIAVLTDDNGNTHQTRAFNSETSEQFNSWLAGYEAQVRQMSATNYDIFFHSLLLLYSETVQARIEKKGRRLTEDFWTKVASSA